jgi:type 1 glutamine amidotransferase
MKRNPGLTKVPVIISHILLLACFSVVLSGNAKASPPSEVLVVTGGHAYDTVAFNKLFFQNNKINADMMAQPKANQALAEGTFNRYETIVFYDMWQDITPQQKQAFLELTKNGTGLVFLHHSLVSYQEWDEFNRIRGGQYLQKQYTDKPEKASGYKHGLQLKVSVLDPGHPVTRDMEDFTIIDEGYSNINILPSVKPLLRVDHPQCTETVAWTNKYNKSRIVYILFGHDNKAYINRAFQNLLSNAIEWVSG